MSRSQPHPDVDLTAPRGRSTPWLRAGTVFVVLSCAAAAVAVARWALLAQEPVAANRFEVSVGSALVPECAPVERHERTDRKPGILSFDLPPGNRLIGIQEARVFEESDGAPILYRSTDVVTAQVKGQLDLRPWIAHKQPSGAWLLHFVLATRQGDLAGAHLGWARIDTSALVHDSLRVRVDPGAHVDVRVETADGQTVPGALVALDVAPERPGLTSSLTYTGADGTVRVFGLESGREMTAALPEGVGPAGGLVSAPFTAGEASRVVVRAELGGSWEFEQLRLVQPLAGASTRIEAARSPGSSYPAAWPVSRWVGPGQGRVAPVYLMRASNGNPRGAVDLTFANYPAVRVDPPGREPLVLSFEPEQNSVIVHAGSDAQDEAPR